MRQKLHTILVMQLAANDISFNKKKSKQWLCVSLLQVDLIRTKRGTRFYRGEPDRQPSRWMLLIIDVKNPPPSLDTSREPNHTCACFSPSFKSLFLCSSLSAQLELLLL